MNMITLTLLMISLGLSGCGREMVGPQGPRGFPGDDAPVCVATSVAPSLEAPNGGVLISCPNSAQLVLNGTNGTDGTNGVDGRDGAPGTIITMIKLCPGTTVYPSKFVEVAFKINDKLCAVYSENGGFMTELPPGYYSSKAINSSCNFTVNSDLTISN